MYASTVYFGNFFPNTDESAVIWSTEKMFSMKLIVMKGSEIQVIKILKISCYWKELDCVVSAKSFDIKGFIAPQREISTCFSTKHKASKHMFYSVVLKDTSM